LAGLAWVVMLLFMVVIPFLVDCLKCMILIIGFLGVVLRHVLFNRFPITVELPSV
jgi:hypothetical protein